MPIDIYHRTEKDIQSIAADLRNSDVDFARWANGYGVIHHSDTTQVRIHELARDLSEHGVVQDSGFVFRTLAAADRITSAAMWLVVHMTYARNIKVKGEPLQAEDFKPNPHGHTGGSLNMVPAYVGYLAANSLSGITRSWLMGQGHCVAAIEAVNLLTGNITAEQAERYSLTDAGLTAFVRDFYSYSITPDGKSDSTLGSHVTPHTGGGLMEGGYLGLAELQYVHMPLPGEHLVAFFSDGAFEEQRGSDWAPRWWRAKDCGDVVPFMIMNGRRIDQRSSMALKGGTEWFCDHLLLNRFTPVAIDGRDPASYAWGIIEMEYQLNESAEKIKRGEEGYPAPLFYGVAETIKGYGFPGEGSSRAHDLPLKGNPADNESARDDFNEGAARLHVDYRELNESITQLNRHAQQHRPKERDNSLATRQVPLPHLPTPPWQNISDADVSAMEGIDDYFCDIVDHNPDFRIRVGNPDEIQNNRLIKTLKKLKHRVTSPEPGISEAVNGCVISALNEEAVASAVVANKAGLNLLASYEAFAIKMLGALRQEMTFSRRQRELGRVPGWITVPVFPSSHTWENGRNGQSHQDTTFCEVLMNEMDDVSRVIFPADWNCALAALRAAYSSYGQIWNVVTANQNLPVYFTPEQAQQLIHDGAIRLKGFGGSDEELMLVATGAYQLREVLLASARLEYDEIPHSVIYLQEPGKFRIPRDTREAEQSTTPELLDKLFPQHTHARVFLTHTRPEPYVGTIWPLLGDPTSTPVLGYNNQGGTLDEQGMLFANQCTWAHVVASATTALGDQPETLLSEEEFEAIAGVSEPAVLFNRTLDNIV